MLPKSKRLTTAEFDAVMKNGRASHSSLFTLRWTDSHKDTRISAVAGQKILKTAVGRNSMRRRIYSSIRKISSRWPKGIHGIIFAKQSAVTAEHKALCIDIESLFVKAGLLR
jgi:ribonuclease P protein component